MLSLALLLAAVVALTSASHAETNGPCDAPAARAFDFWIGDWSIEQKILRADGSWLALPARTSVTRALDGCALLERWEGEVQFFWEGMQSVETMKGLSVRARDPATGQWHIHWMDSRKPAFGTPYVGEFVAGRGEFFREWETPQGKRKGRITFSAVSATSVKWDLAVSADGGQKWSTIWVMEMSRLGSATTIDP